MKKRMKLKRIIVFWIVFIMLFTTVPWKEIGAYAADPVIDEIVLGRLFSESRDIKSTYVEIKARTGEDITNLVVTYNKPGTGQTNFSNRTILGKNHIKFVMTPQETMDFTGQLTVGGKYIEVNLTGLPIINGVSPSRIKDNDMDPVLTINGSNLTNVVKSSVDASEFTFETNIYKSATYRPIASGDIKVGGTDSNVRIDVKRGTPLGAQDIIFTKSRTADGIKIKAEQWYEKQFSYIRDLPISDLKMYPNIGSRGDIVYFTGKGLTSSHKVHFLKDITGIDTYKDFNMGQGQTAPVQNPDETVTMTIKVPQGLELTEYFVVITESQNGEAIGEKIVRREDGTEEKFIVIDSKKRANITAVSPETGPNSGQSVTLQGKNISTINLHDFAFSTSGTKVDLDTSDKKSLVLQYVDTNGDEVTGQYKGETVTVKKRIWVTVGQQAEFETGKNTSSKFSDAIDNLFVIAKLDEGITQDTPKDVVVGTETIFYVNGIEKYKFREDALYSKKYIFTPSQVLPEISAVVPDKIQVENGQVKEEILLAIYGKNFAVYRNTDANQKITMNYPSIVIGDGEIEINANEGGYYKYKLGNQMMTLFGTDGNPIVPKIYVLDKDNNVLDGSTGKQLGTKMIVTLPQQIKVENLGAKDVRVINPIRNSNSPGLSATAIDAIRFVTISESPLIESVEPSIVTVKGGEKITVSGSGFQQGIRVFIDGNEILQGRITREISMDGKKIILTFDAPPGREGTTQLQVMNPDGGIDVHDFTYVKSFEKDPKLISLNPPVGTEGTPVVVRGDNFLRANPAIGSTAGQGIYSLIGTRILMDGKEINDYQRDVQGRIILKEYTSHEPLIKAVNSRLSVANYYHSIILETEGTGKYYTLDVTPTGQVLLSDGNTQTILIAEGSTIKTNMGAAVTVEADRITVGNMVLKMKTPYQYDSSNGIIYGNRIKIINKNELIFMVPRLEPGKYDVTVINPDTKKDTKAKAFEYKASPAPTTPVIESIYPNQGDQQGGYFIEIKGQYFENNMNDPSKKTKVYFNGIQVLPADVLIELDGKTMRAKVPKYPGDIRQETGTDRKTVPVVLVNDGGGTASKLDGFTYVVPRSQPIIKNIDPKSGNAAGGIIVRIEGSDFRLYEPFVDFQGDNVKEYKEELMSQADANKLIQDGIEEAENRKLHNGQYYFDRNKNNKPDPLLYYIDIDGDDKWTDLRGLSDIQSLTEAQKKVLPKIYFGDNLVTKYLIVSNERLEVKLPKGTKGKVDVYVVNNDNAISNKVAFTYEGSSPKIDSINPPSGTKEGRLVLDILGSGFASSRVQVYEATGQGINQQVEKTMPIIRFGDLTNRDKKLNEENHGSIDGGLYGTVSIGGVSVVYNGNRDTLQVSVEVGTGTQKVVYSKIFENYHDTEVFIPLYLLEREGDATQKYDFYEIMKVEIDKNKNRLIVERGYAPEAQLKSSGHIQLKAPAYPTARKVAVTVVNPDNSTAKGEFTYTNPDSNPKIEMVKRDGNLPENISVPGYGEIRLLQFNSNGGNIMNITGSDFRTNAKVSIVGSMGRIEIQPKPEDVKNNQISLVMPKADVKYISDINIGDYKLFKIIVQNKDGGNASSTEIENQKPIYIIFVTGESKPTIQNVTPNKGPVSGGTKVQIQGEEIRKTMKGYEGRKLAIHFGNTKIVDGENGVIERINDTTVQLTVPKSETHGLVDVKIENPDGELAILPKAFTYISEPKIEKMDPPKLFRNDTNTEVTITGKMFMPGAKVVIGGKVISKQDVKKDMVLLGEGIRGVDASGTNIEVAVVGGKLATAATVVNDTTMKVKFSEALDLESSDIVIINPDGGVSQPYTGFEYQIPVPSKPLVLEAIPGAESTVQLLWSESDPEILNAADRYEIYGKKSSDKNYTLIGDTRGASFLVKRLQPNTRYSFMVRALNKYGSAIEFAEVSVTTLSEREDDKLREKKEQVEREKQKGETEGKEETVDGILVKTIGSKQIPTGNTPYVIDFSLSKYKGQNKFVISIPVTALQSINRQITVTDGKASFTFLPKDLITREVSQVDAKDIGDAYVRVGFEKVTGKAEEAVKTAILRTQRQASQVYEISFSLQAAKSISNIGRMQQKGTIDIKYDAMAYPLANKDKLFMGEYNPSQDKIVNIGNGSRGSSQNASRYVLLSER